MSNVEHVAGFELALKVVLVERATGPLRRATRPTLCVRQPAFMSSKHVRAEARRQVAAENGRGRPFHPDSCAPFRLLPSPTFNQTPSGTAAICPIAKSREIL